MKLVIIYPWDPCGSKIGGAETFLKGLIKYAPSNISIEFIGITSKISNMPLNKWASLHFGNKSFNFYPILKEDDENLKTKIPLALRFTFKLLKSNINFKEKVLFFNRIEPALAFRFINSPKILVIHNDIKNQIKGSGSDVLWSKIPSIYFLFEKFIFSFMSYIYTVSQKSVAFYKKQYPAYDAKVGFLATWVDPEIFYLSKTLKYDLRIEMGYEKLISTSKWILFVGRLQEQKAPMRLIETFFEYSKSDPKAILLIIGEGDLKKKTMDYVNSLGLKNNVLFLGGMTQNEIVKYYQAANCFLLVSNYEGMPMSALEALGCGLPVITTNVGEVNRIVKNGFSGEIVNNKNPKNIAFSMKKVLNSKNAYTKENCLNISEAYQPKKVLIPFYRKIKDLNKN
jgi:glycosyltransferase involved in cell wall biosynthesis